MKKFALIFACIMIFSLSSCNTNEKDPKIPSQNNIENQSDPNKNNSSSLDEIIQEKKVSVLPQINTITLDGDSVTGEEFIGNKLTILNIWATWCPPCIAELPHLQEISEYYADENIKVIGVMQDGVTSKLGIDEDVVNTGKTLLEDASAKYMVILPDKIIAEEFLSQMQYFPTTFFIDSEGNVVKTVVGSKDTKGWKKEIDNVLSNISK